MKIREKNTVHSGKIFEVNIETHLMPDGRSSDFEMVRHPGGSAVLPVLEDGKLLLIRQYRPALGKDVYEIPAGRLEPHELPLECAVRELQEETGFRARKIELLGGLWSTPGFCDEYIYLYCATGLVEAEQQLEPDELIELFPVSLEDALTMVFKDEILDSKTQLALLRYHHVVAGEKKL